MIWSIILFALGFAGGILFWSWHMAQLQKVADSVASRKNDEIRRLRENYRILKEDYDRKDRCSEASSAYRLGAQNARKKAA